jgi:hypothetical protein
VPGPLVEQVAAERHPLAYGAAEQVADRYAGLATLQVEAGDLEGGVDGVDGRVDVEHPAERRAATAGLPAEHVGHEAAQAVQVVRVVAAERGGDGLQPGEVGLVGVRLTEAEQAGVGVQLDDRAQGVGLVDADHVEQRRVLERDRCDDDAGDAAPAHCWVTTVVTGEA